MPFSPLPPQGNTVPDSAAPGSTRPDSAAPGSTRPDSAAPGIPLPEEAAPGHTPGIPSPANSLPSGPPLSRRRFILATGALGAAGLAAGVGAGATHPWTNWGRKQTSTAAATTLKSGTGTLVLVTLYGGNDGLNTVIPYLDSAYHAGRPTLGYQPNEVVPLTDGLALNAKLTGMKSLWDAKQLAIVRGVGYPDPSLSHFQSMDIWQTASLSADGSGWLGRWLDATGTDPLRAISVGNTLPPALRGQKTAATALTSASITLPGKPPFQSAYGLLGAPGPDRSGLAAVISQTGNDLLSVKGDLDKLHAQPVTPTATSGATASGAKKSGAKKSGAKASGSGTTGTLSEQLALVSSLIRAGAPTKVYQVSLSSFDTHADEKATQEGLLTELDQGVSSFLASLKGAPHADGVVLMTYSEFGRRVAENASGGTDHGTASPLFVAGPAVRGGQFYGDQPSLTALDAGDLHFTVDFRSVYATMLERVVGVDPKAFLGSSYPILDLL